jgi:hypothetical protein
VLREGGQQVCRRRRGGGSISLTWRRPSKPARRSSEALATTVKAAADPWLALEFWFQLV